MTNLPPFSMRAVCGIAGSLFAFALAAGRCEKLAPPGDQWPWLLVFAMLNYGLFVVLTTEARVYLTASEAVTITYTLPIWHLADLGLDFGVADVGEPSVSLSVLLAIGSTVLTTASGKFRIEGHTDTVGTADANKALSAARAKAVADYLASTYHVDPSKLQAIGMGEDGLLVKTPAQTSEIRNRRVVIVNLGG